MTTLNFPTPLELNLELTDEQFFQLCQNNRDFRFERTPSGELIIMPPTGSDTGRRNIKITTQLEIWNNAHKSGVAFDSSTGFKFPNGANLSPDAAWIKIERWNAIPPEEQEKFAPICPDFVVELCSPSDRLQNLQEKMQVYRENGVKLGWLLDRKNRRVEIYRPGQDVEVLENPPTLSGEDVLPGFVLDLTEIL